MGARSIFLLLSCIIVVIFSLIFFTPGFEGIKRIIELQLVGRLSVQGVPPDVIAVYVENSGQYYYCDVPGGYNPPRIDAIQNSYRQIRFNATVYDINGDCDGGATFYICANETAVPPTYCDAGHSVYSINIPTPYVQYGGNLYCNYSATYDLYYFRRCGNWYVNVTALDRESRVNSTVRWWKDNLLASVWYPYDEATNKIGDLVYMGNVVLNQWNFGLGQNMTKNTGNTNITSLVWNATNFTRVGSPSDVIPIIPFNGNTTFAVDDDTDIMNGAGYINETPIVQTSFPSYGVYRCEDDACTSARAKYYLWWHIHTPPAVPSGIYENVITYNINPMGCD